MKEGLSMSISLQTLCSNLEGLLNLKAILTQEPINEEILRKLELWGAGSFTIVVMGEIKAGKSSFINALLGHRDLVPFWRIVISGNEASC